MNSEDAEKDTTSEQFNNVQFIEHDGKPAFAVIPYRDYQILTGEYKGTGVTYPSEVAELVLLQDMSLLAAWRKHLKVSQAELAKRMGVTQGTISQMERPDSKPQRATIEKAAKALGITPEQLTD